MTVGSKKTIRLNIKKGLSEFNFLCAVKIGNEVRLTIECNGHEKEVAVYITQAVEQSEQAESGGEKGALFFKGNCGGRLIMLLYFVEGGGITSHEYWLYGEFHGKFYPQSRRGWIETSNFLDKTI